LVEQARTAAPTFRLAHPTSHRAKVAGFDIGTDIGLDNEPPDLHD
jgi:hypothetical protein